MKQKFAMTPHGLMAVMFGLLLVAGCGPAHHVVASPDYPVDPGLKPASPGFSEDRHVDVFLHPNPRCYRESCEGSGDCNTACVRVEPLHAKIFYNSKWRPGADPAEAGFVAGRARQARWVVQCVKNPKCLTGSEECIGINPCLGRKDTLVIRPASDADFKQKRMLEESGFEQHFQDRDGCRPKDFLAHRELFSPATGGVFKIPGPANVIYSGPPIRPRFTEADCSPTEGEQQHKVPRRLEWYYDVELVRDGKVIMRLDPELWVEEETKD